MELTDSPTFFQNLKENQYGRSTPNFVELVLFC